jgi:hypothetical protein
MSEQVPEAVPNLTPEERQLGDKLLADRPVPTAGFRGALGRYVEELDPGYGWRPSHMRLKVAAYLAVAVLLLLLALLQARGAL